MGDALSQEQIDALLKSANLDESESELSESEVDALGEIGNICMGSSATALNEILKEKISIDTPSVKIITWSDIANDYKEPCVCVKVHYTLGLEGCNLMLLKKSDAKIIANLMLEGSGARIDDSDDETTSEIYLSAVSEAMNQIVGSSATSMSLLISKKVDISPPEAFIVKIDPNNPDESFKGQDKLVKISFKMEVEGLLNSDIMQILPIKFAKKFIKNLLDFLKGENQKNKLIIESEQKQEENNINKEKHSISSFENIDNIVDSYKKQFENLKLEYEYIKTIFESEINYLRNESLEKNKQLNKKDELLKNMQETMLLLIKK